MTIGGSNRLLPLAAAAEYLAVSKSTLYHQWRSWGLTAHRIGGHLRFRERELERFIESCAERAA